MTDDLDEFFDKVGTDVKEKCYICGDIIEGKKHKKMASEGGGYSGVSKEYREERKVRVIYVCGKCHKMMKKIREDEPKVKMGTCSRCAGKKRHLLTTGEWVNCDVCGGTGRYWLPED